MAYKCNYNSTEYLFENIDLYHFCTVLSSSDAFGLGNGFDLLRGEFKALTESFKLNSADKFKRTARKILTQLHPDKVIVLPQGREIYRYAANKCAPLAYYFNEQFSITPTDEIKIRTLSNIMSRPFVAMAAFRGQPSLLVQAGLEYEDSPMIIEPELFRLLEEFGNNEINVAAQYLAAMNSVATQFTFSYVGFCVAAYSAFLVSEAIWNRYNNFAKVDRQNNASKGISKLPSSTLLSNNLSDFFDYTRILFAINTTNVLIEEIGFGLIYSPQTAVNASLAATGVTYAAYATYIVSEAVYRVLFAKPLSSENNRIDSELISGEIRDINGKLAPKLFSGAIGLGLVYDSWDATGISSFGLYQSFEENVPYAGIAVGSYIAGYLADKAISAGISYLFSSADSVKIQGDNDPTAMDLASPQELRIAEARKQAEDLLNSENIVDDNAKLENNELPMQQDNETSMKVRLRV